MLAVGIVSYHVAAIALLAGLSRYRLPLEPLWMVFLALALASPRESYEALMGDPRRLLPVMLVLPPLLMLMTWMLPYGFPGYLW